MSFDKTEVIVQTLKNQIGSLQGRADSLSREINEHEGASQVCKQLANKALGYKDLIESRLADEYKDDEETAQKIRVYTNNLIVRLHSLCETNSKEQKNQVLISRGRLDETKKSAQRIATDIDKHLAFAKQREEQAEEAEKLVEDAFDMSDSEPATEPPKVAAVPPIPKRKETEDDFDFSLDAELPPSGETQTVVGSSSPPKMSRRNLRKR